VPIQVDLEVLNLWGVRVNTRYNSDVWKVEDDKDLSSSFKNLVEGLEGYED
jgi:hypothetical protein